MAMTGTGLQTERMARLREELSPQEEERLDLALAELQKAAYERLAAARAAGRTDPDEMRAEFTALVHTVRRATSRAATAQALPSILEELSQELRSTPFVRSKAEQRRPSIL